MGEVHIAQDSCDIVDCIGLLSFLEPMSVHIYAAWQVSMPHCEQQRVQAVCACRQKAYIRHTIAELLAVHKHTNRRLASVAGVLMSVSTAIYMHHCL